MNIKIPRLDLSFVHEKKKKRKKSHRYSPLQISEELKQNNANLEVEEKELINDEILIINEYESKFGEEKEQKHFENNPTRNNEKLMSMITNGFGEMKRKNIYENKSTKEKESKVFENQILEMLKKKEKKSQSDKENIEELNNQKEESIISNNKSSTRNISLRERLTTLTKRNYNFFANIDNIGKKSNHSESITPIQILHPSKPALCLAKQESETTFKEAPNRKKMHDYEKKRVECLEAADKKEITPILGEILENEGSRIGEIRQEKGIYVSVEGSKTNKKSEGRGLIERRKRKEERARENRIREMNEDKENVNTLNSSLNTTTPLSSGLRLRSNATSATNSINRSKQKHTPHLQTTSSNHHTSPSSYQITSQSQSSHLNHSFALPLAINLHHFQLLSQNHLHSNDTQNDCQPVSHFENTQDLDFNLTKTEFEFDFNLSRKLDFNFTVRKELFDDEFDLLSNQLDQFEHTVIQKYNNWSHICSDIHNQFLQC